MNSTKVVNVGDLSIDLEHPIVKINGTRLRVAGRQYQILQFLAKNIPTQPTTTSAIVDYLYPIEKEGPEWPENNLKVLIYHLRNKLRAASGGREYIHNPHRKGYELREPAA